jgi:rhomboid protease GluP
MLKRQKSGSVVCPSCGRLVGVAEPKCPFCGRASPGMFGFGDLVKKLGQDIGVVELVVGGCVFLYLLTLVADMQGIRSTGMLGFLSPSTDSLRRFGASGALPVIRDGRWWTVLSAGWLHGGAIHILFNMMWVRNLAPICVAIYGPSRTILLYTASSVLGFVLSTLGLFAPQVLTMIMGRGILTVGASAAVFGLLGATVYAGKRGIASSFGRQAWMYAIVLFVFGLVFPGVDNWAHLGGFLGGYLMARWLDPFKPERTDHMIYALLCLAATILAIVASVLHYPFVSGS